MQASDPRRLLLDLLGTRSPIDRERVLAITPGEWRRITRMAREHRLEPLLHAQHSANDAVPAATRAEWREQHRAAGLAALVQQAELGETGALLERHGFAPIALKGAWLARYAYPSAAQRPLRDLDLLLSPETVVPAFEHLRASGYRLEDPLEMALDSYVAIDKHLPPLIAPRGTRVELHHRLWEPEGRLDHHAPERDEAAVRDRSIRLDGIAYPAPDDMLAHLIVHAAYSHRLDCGPLILSDIAFLVRREQIDWAAFWDRAAAQGWREGARLLLALATAYREMPAVDLTDGAGPAPPRAVVEAAPALLLQAMNTRQSAGFIAAVRNHGFAGLWQRLRSRLSTREGATAARSHATEGGFLAWARSRLARTAADALTRGALRQSRDLAAFSRWLDRR
ncbi:MAG: nucleotidyltransferase family protein [Novosphingobium sp.]|nr:nucleotidyltransferase family protein [Novosphingobium sp.]